MVELTDAEKTYVRINAASVYVGQLSSWTIYPQNKLPIEKTIALLPRLKNGEVVLDSAVNYNEKDGDFCFIDPPYKNTSGNYKTKTKTIEKDYLPQQTKDLISRLSCPIIFTYGTDAKNVFPEFNWQEVLIKNVPKINSSGKKSRIEHVTFINWK